LEEGRRGKPKKARGPPWGPDTHQREKGHDGLGMKRGGGGRSRKTAWQRGDGEKGYERGRETEKKSGGESRPGVGKSPSGRQ